MQYFYLLEFANSIVDCRPTWERAAWCNFIIPQNTQFISKDYYYQQIAWMFLCDISEYLQYVQHGIAKLQPARNAKQSLGNFK